MGSIRVHNRSNFLHRLPLRVPYNMSIDPQRRTFVGMTKLTLNYFDVRAAIEKQACVSVAERMQPATLNVERIQ